MLFLAADIGVFISGDEGASWHRYDHGLPNAPVVQLSWSDGELHAVTMDE